MKQRQISIREKLLNNGVGSLSSDRLKTVSFYSLCLITADCALTGGGRWLMFGPVSLRMTFFAVAFICGFPSMIRGAKRWLRNPMMVSFALLVLYLAVCAARGMAAGNRIDVLLADVKGFAWLLIVPVALAVADCRARLKTLMKAVIVAASVQALLIIALNIALMSGAIGAEAIGELMLKIRWGFIDNVTDTMYRIFMSSGPYIAAGCVFLLYFQIRRSKFSWLYPVLMGLMLCALLLTFTRSLYLAAAAAIIPAAALFIIYAPNTWRRMVTHAVISAVAALALVLFQQAASDSDYLRFALARTFSSDLVSEIEMDTPDSMLSPEGKKLRQEQQYLERTKQSDNNIREVTLRELKEMISRSPVFGNGLGAAVKCREDGLVEYFYYDKLNKTGVLGLALYLFPAVYMAYLLVRGGRKNKDCALTRTAWYAALLAFLAATYFNPYMNASLGITCYSLAAACFSIREKQLMC